MSGPLFWIAVAACFVGVSVVVGGIIGKSLKAADDEPEWIPECPLARAELRRSRTISWDYDKFQYHLRRAFELERQFQAAKKAKR